MVFKKQFGNIIVARNSDRQWGVIDSNNNIIVPFGKYAWIDGFDNGLCRVRTHGRDYDSNVFAIMTDDAFITDKTAIKQILEEDYKNNSGLYAKWGIINMNGEEVLPAIYDKVWNFYGKNRFSTKAILRGVEYRIFFHDLNPNLPVKGFEKNSRGFFNDTMYENMHSYGEYAGSYAQDVLGYSDEYIDYAFDGDPEAYWNID